MKAFLLAAGHGTRLRPITDTIPKCLVPIREVPLLEIWLELCAGYGINEVLINLHAHQEIVSEFLEKNSLKSQVKVTVSQEETLLGSAGTLRANRKWVEDDPYFWVFYADVLNAVDLSRMAEFHECKDVVATIGVYTVPDPSRCGIVTADDAGIVRDFVEKPALPKRNTAFSGIMLASPKLFDDIPDVSPVDIGFHVLPRLVHRMAAYKIEEYLIDIGTIENYRLAQENWPGLKLRGRECSRL
jgi:mannose-1-phosphate guanylyltransferase